MTSHDEHLLNLEGVNDLEVEEEKRGQLDEDDYQQDIDNK